LPPLYEQSYTHYTRQGARVLALGYKEMAAEAMSKLKSKKREDVECNLTFAGLVVYHCPNKFESATSVQGIRMMATMFASDFIHRDTSIHRDT